MDLIIYIQIFLCAMNICFTLTGTILNSLVIIIFWKSSQLRKKLCYLMIIVLSCVDVLSTVAYHPLLVIFLIIILTGHSDNLMQTILTYGRITSMFYGFSLITLFVMSLERYLSTAFPIFHRKAVTRNRLLTLLGVLFAFEIILLAISSSVKAFSYEVKVTVFQGLF